MNNIPYIVQTCDAGNHRRKDRPNGGLYIGEGLVNLTIAAMQPSETLIVCRKRKHTASHLMDSMDSPSLKRSVALLLFALVLVIM